MYFYLESRGGDYDLMVPAGTRMWLQMFFSRPIDQEDIDEAEEFCMAQNGSFNGDPETGWPGILKYHGGYMPLKIKGVPEGTVMKTSVPMLTVECTDKRFAWLAGYFETVMQRYAWVATTIATNSFHLRMGIKKEMLKTGMSKEEVEAYLPWMMNDFGARGVMEPIYTGLGHLMSFSGSDNMEATYAVNQVYNAKMSSQSIAASEHSIMTLMGREGEFTMAESIVDEYGPQGRKFAMVMDSYDIDNFIDSFVGKRLKDKIVKYGTENGAKFIGRPDSGEPTQMLPHVVRRFLDIFGYETVNGFDRLPPYVGAIQGDGINRHSTIEVMKACSYRKFASTNYCFGSGGGLLQQFNRDTLKFAQKLSAVENAGGWYDTCKDPADAHWKASKAGRVGAYWVEGETFPKSLTLEESKGIPGISDAMIIYYWKAEEMPKPLVCGEDWDVITERLRNFDSLVLV